jgi:chemotaxis protein CheX
MSGVPLPPDQRAAGGSRPSAHDLVDVATLEEILTLTWTTFVDPDADLVPTDMPADLAGATVAEVSVRGEAPVRVSISIDGTGARIVTERMLGGLGAVDDADVSDAIGELANVLGGNLKALLPEGSTLSLPTVRLGVAYQPTDAAEVVARVRWYDHVVTASVTATAPAEMAGAATSGPAAGEGQS